MNDKSRVLMFILKGELVDKEIKRLKRGFPLKINKNEDKLKEAVGRAFFNKINKRRLKSIYYLGKNQQNENLVIFPPGIFGDGYGLGIIEVNIDRESGVVSVTFIDVESGKAKLERYREESYAI